MADAAQVQADISASAEARRSRTSTPVQIYLILYNFISAILWSTILGRVILITAIHGTGMVYLGVGQFTKWTQTLALLEVVHAAIGRSLPRSHATSSCINRVASCRVEELRIGKQAVQTDA